ncbi:hypothetical protein JYU34_005558 [Plutella xylostella]|uniref:Partner of Y14 and mago n=1 Tax=Plutella xylostella TaxID=51655 RepID=A0ABQ7QTJ0_PLUXY|nr:hypothetical protein JYU34_005558 [Plutella xylostella]
MATTTSYEHDADGCKFIPASQRPDGTWRKPRRVKEGYVPQDEVPLYESKGKQFAARQTGLPVGLTPEIVAAAQKKKPQGGMIQPIPGMLVSVDKTKKKKKKKTVVDDTADKFAKCEITEPTFEPPNKPSPPSAPSQADPVKRLKNLRKKLRDIETLEEKIKAGLLKQPDKDQREKMSKKTEVLKEIEDLEKLGVE